MVDFKAFNLWFAKKFGFGGEVRRRVWLKLAKLMENGVPIKTALESMRSRRARMKGEQDALVYAFDDWLTQINNGRRFSDAIAEWVRPDEHLLIAAGEQSGRLEKALYSSVELINAAKRIKSAIIGGVTYPIVLVLLAFGVLYLFGVKIIPAFSGVVSEDKWTGIAATMIDVSHFVQNWLWLVALLFVATITVILLSMPRWTGEIRVKFDAFPPWSVYRVVQGSSWMLALSSLVAAGVRIENALQLMNERASPWLRERIDALLMGLRSGQSIGESLARSGYNFPDPEIIDDLGVYSQLSSFDQALEIIGKELLESSIETIQQSMKLVFNAGLVLVGVLLSWMIGGMISMQMQMSKVIGGAF